MTINNIVYCEMPLPDGWETKPDYQFESKTPLLKQGGLFFKISSDGDLSFTAVENSDLWHPLKYNGPLFFFGHEAYEHMGYTPIWHEYRASFTKGKCHELIKVRNMSERITSEYNLEVLNSLIET